MRVLHALFGDEARIVGDRNLQLLLVANGLGALGIALLSPIVESLTGPFGVSVSTVGLVMSAFSAPSILVIPLAGVVSDRTGRKPVLVGGLALFGVAGGAIALTNDFRVVLGLRFLQGVGFAGILPIIITSIGDLYSGPTETAAQGFRFSLTGVAQVVFPVVASLLVVVAWQYPFLFYLLAVPVAGLVHLAFDEPTSPSDRRAADENLRPYLRRLAALVRDPEVAAVVVARGLPAILWIGLLTYVSVVVQVLDGEPLQAGVLVAAASFALTVVATQAGRISAAFDSKVTPLAISAVCLGVGTAVVGAAPSIPVAGAGIAVAGVGTGLFNPLYRSYITHVAPDSLRGGLVSLAEAFAWLLVTLAPILWGLSIGLLGGMAGDDAAVRWTAVGLSALVSAGSFLCLWVVARSTDQ